ncbi:hypothetical protein CC1G_00793 [Coprinopsis cinerea okayama7|uniref:F-box domain-containing protein n=1 Tax=Coprinopsis cinerea (strain Okayama-7 / 130 / ATCC MYA-4618 / FGSC 9003) TaxID=240176 RepID=A8N8R8_COPC7|nr:hypothetical protein CC1G_00793 [Coprinopsis cinerea okayama7\|eukprot:XP_001831246.1 hypothetical protein CC1G_00793 [Coprinopsis cinerea okayama7\
MEADEPSTVQDEVTSDNELHIPNEIIHEILNHYLHSLPIREDNLDAILLPASVCRGWQIYICEQTNHWPTLEVSFQRESSVIRNTTLANFLHSPAGAAAPVPSPLTIDMSKFDRLNPEHVGLLESALELLPRANDALKLRSPGPPEMAWSRLKWTAIQNAIFEGRKLRALILEGDLPMDFCHKALSICGTGLEKLSLKGVSQASKRLPWPLPRVPLPALEDLEMEFVTDIRQLVTSLDCPKITNLALSTDSEWLMEDVAGYDFHYANLTKLVCRAPEYTRLAAAEKILQRTPNLEALEWIGDCITHGQQQLVSLQLPFLRSLKVSHPGRQDSVFETLLNKSQVYDEVCLPNLLLPVHAKTLRINTPMSTLACLSLLADSQHLEEGFFELNDSIEDVDEFTISMYLSPQTPSLNVPNLRKVTFLVHGPNRGFYQRLPIPRGVEVVIRNCLKCEMLGGGSFCDSL